MARGKADLSISKLRAFLDQQMDKKRTLLRERKRLLKAVAKVDAKINALEGNGSGRPKRGEGSKSLVEVMKETLGTFPKGLKIPQIMEEVQKAGYVSSSDNFRAIVSQALIREKKAFTKLDRGLYTYKKSND